MSKNMTTYTSAAVRLLLLGAVIRIEALVLPRQSSSSSTRRSCRRPLPLASPHPYASSSPFLVATTKQSSSSSVAAAATATTSNRPLTAKKEDDLDDDDDDDEEASRRPGMEEAFRQLNELESLLDDDDDNKPVLPPKKKKIDADTTSSLPDDTIKEVSPEQEIKVYKDMVGELEQNEDAEAYSDIMNELGGKPKQVEDTYSQVMSDLGGTPKPKNLDGDDDDVGSSTSEIDTERFMDSALQEALKEVKVNNPKILGDSILDNKEIMKEIEDIFEEGNEKLLASLEEIRQEQQQLAKASATANAQKAENNMQGEAQRLQNAEQSMTKQLQKVAQETAEVEKALADLKAAQEELDSNFMVKLKTGGLPKQAALAGFVLFSIRSILDSVTALNTGDPSSMSAALAQGVIALVCAALFFFF